MALPAYAMNLSSFPEMYERWLVGPLFRPWAEDLVRRMGLAPGNRLLDVACGTGIVARLAKEQIGHSGRVVGIDASPPMLAIARAQDTDIDWREGNAVNLPVEDGETFDVVACQQGLQFFPDKRAAAREMRRVLAPLGRLAAATWRPVEESPFLRDLHRVAEKHLGTVLDRRHGFGDASALGSLFADAGFHDVRVDTLSKTIRFADGIVFVRLNTMALVGMSAASAAMSDEERGRAVEAIASESVAVLASYADTSGDALAFAMSSNVVTARG